MKDEIIESIFGCLERIEEKFDKQPVQTEQGKSEDKENLAEAIMPLADSMNRTNRNLCVRFMESAKGIIASARFSLSSLLPCSV